MGCLIRSNRRAVCGELWRCRHDLNHDSGLYDLYAIQLELKRHHQILYIEVELSHSGYQHLKTLSSLFVAMSWKQNPVQGLSQVHQGGKHHGTRNSVPLLHPDHQRSQGHAAARLGDSHPQQTTHYRCYQFKS